MVITKSTLLRLKAATSRSDIADILDIDLKNLTYLLYKQQDSEKYTSFNINKKNGGVREISAPSKPLKSLQSKTATLLQNCLLDIEISTGNINSSSHGFRPEKSIFTNASRHRNKRFVLNLDLKDFFPTITFPRIRGFLIQDKYFSLHKNIATILAQIACLDSKLPQGSPCSPVISNMIAGILDLHLSKLAKSNNCTYTRYADDITFSTNKRDFPKSLAFSDPQMPHEWKLGRQLLGLIKKCGFCVNESKTRLQYKTSRQQVTGLVVNKKVNVPAEYRHLVRAYVHSLVNTGAFTTKVATKTGDEKIIVENVLGSNNQLHGMLGFIHATDSVYRTNLERHSYNYPGIKIDEKKPTGSLAIYRRFLLYTLFYANNKPLVVCEGKTDNVYLSNAIHQNKKICPSLLTKNDDGKDVLALQFFKYARKHSKKNHVYLPNFSTAKILGNGSGGGPNLAGLITTYNKESKKFNSPSGDHPVIFVVDNDSGGQPVFAAIKKISGINVTGKESFIHVFRNLYVVPIPLTDKKTATIEDLFSDADKGKIVDGKPFDFSKDADEKVTAGKASFAYDFVAKKPEEIDFSRFEPLLITLSDVIADHKK